MLSAERLQYDITIWKTQTLQPTCGEHILGCVGVDDVHLEHLKEKDFEEALVAGATHAVHAEHQLHKVVHQTLASGLEEKAAQRV
jgi:hypothetical protein